ncbi:MAG: hypothetical protein CL398_04555 [Acidiferrobacteraceae bacterium]|nr:hypothetical protein [Acidiferrobacteraceae bacterium]
MRGVHNFPLFLFLLFSLGLVGCGLTLDQKKQSSTPNLFAKIDRSPCIGECPVFSLAIYFDGTAVFYGKKNTNTIGEKNLKLGKNQLLQISDEFTRKGFLIMNDSCCDCHDADGASSSVITYQGNGPYKQLKNYHGCSSLRSKELIELEDIILELTGVRVLIDK